MEPENRRRIIFFGVLVVLALAAWMMMRRQTVELPQTFSSPTPIARNTTRPATPTAAPTASASQMADGQLNDAAKVSEAIAATERSPAFSALRERMNKAAAAEFFRTTGVSFKPQAIYDYSLEAGLAPNSYILNGESDNGHRASVIVARVNSMDTIFDMIQNQMGINPRSWSSVDPPAAVSDCLGCRYYEFVENDLNYRAVAGQLRTGLVYFVVAEGKTQARKATDWIDFVRSIQLNSPSGM